MSQINFARKEISCKIVYYGPGMCGKTTNIEMVHKKIPENNKGQLVSIATEGDRTLFFDFLPVNLGQIGGMGVKLQLYTVPGQVYYNSTRRLVLQGTDGVVFVADSQSSKEQENRESLADLEENLKSYGLDLNGIPLVIQFNKRDLPDVMDVAKMRAALNKYNVPDFEAVAFKGEGVFPTLKSISKLVIDKVQREYLPSGQSQSDKNKVVFTPASSGTSPVTVALPLPQGGTGQVSVQTGSDRIGSGNRPSVKIEPPVSQPVVSALVIDKKIVVGPVSQSVNSSLAPARRDGTSKAAPPFPKPVPLPQGGTGQVSVAKQSLSIAEQSVIRSGSVGIKPSPPKITTPLVPPAVGVVQSSSPRKVVTSDSPAWRDGAGQKEFPLVWIIIIIALVVISMVCLVLFTR